MSLNNIFSIAGSGMSAQSVRLNTTASNIANADSVSSSVVLKLLPRPLTPLLLIIYSSTLALTQRQYALHHCFSGVHYFNIGLK